MKALPSSQSRPAAQHSEIASLANSNTESVAKLSPVEKMSKEEAWESLSGLHPEQISLGKRVRDSIRTEWLDACHETSGAQSLVFALLLSHESSLAETEVALLADVLSANDLQNCRKWAQELQAIHSREKIALIDLSIPALRHLTPEQYQRFRYSTEKLIASDGVVDLFEFCLQRMLWRHLDHFYGLKKEPKIRFTKALQVRDSLAVLLSTVAGLQGDDSPTAVKDAFAQGAKTLKQTTSVHLDLLPPERCTLTEIEAALGKLSESSPLVQKALLEAACASVLHDEHISSREAEIVRALADTMHAPIPPFVRVS